MERVQQAFVVQQTPNSTPAQIKEANQWLEQFQGTQEAWQVADQLLALEASADAAGALVSAAHIFAAQTMRTKIQYDWADLPPSSHDALRGSLLGHVVRFAPGPQPVLTQLCLAVALLSLWMESWATPVSDLIGNLTTPPEQAMVKLPALLELLTVLPEETENNKVQILPRRRSDCRERLTAASPQVLQLLVQVCSQCRAQEDTMGRLLRCLGSWLRNASLPPEQLASASCPLLPFAFASMAAPRLADVAADVLVDLVHYSAGNSCGNRADEHQALIQAVLPQVLQLLPQYDAALAAEDEDLCRALCRVFTETGEQYLHLLLQSAQGMQAAVEVVRAVLRGAAHPEREVAEITFNFWYVLSEELAGGGRVLSDSQRAVGRELFAPAYMQLVDSLRVLVEYPDDSDSMTDDDRDEFKKFRYSVGDVLSDACKVLTSVTCLERVFGVLQARLPALAADPAAHWRYVEGCVYSMRQMVAINRNQFSQPAFFSAEVVGNFMRLLPTLPAVGELQSTCIRTVGTYARWFGQNPELLPQILAYVSQGLTQEAMAAPAAQSMRHLCDACAEHLADEASMTQLVQMYLGTLALPLHNADRVDLISALAFVVSQLPSAQMLPAMQAIAQPRVTRLRAVLGGEAPVGGGSPAKEVADLLEELCALLRDVKPKASDVAQEASEAALGGAALQDMLHPSVTMLNDLWEVFAAVFARHGADTRCMERLCRCYKHTARNCGDAFAAVLPQLLPQVTAWFELQPQSCFLYVANVCAGNYGGTPEYVPLFADAYHRMSAATFQLLSPPGGGAGLVDNPDVVDDFFELSSKVLKKMPSLLLETPSLLDSVFMCGCAGLHVQHREANRSVVSFFETLVGLPRAPTPPPAAALQALLGVLTARGGNLVHAMVFAIAGILPQQRLRFLVPVLRTLADMEAATCRGWVQAAVQSLPADAHSDGAILLNALFSPEALQRDAAAFDRDAFGNAIDAFSSACRRKRIL